MPTLAYFIRFHSFRPVCKADCGQVRTLHANAKAACSLTFGVLLIGAFHAEAASP